MSVRVLQNLAIFAAGIIAAAAFVGLYWQSNKDELSLKVLSKVAQGNYCAPEEDGSASDSNVEETEPEVYFVGCGGFF